MLAYGCPLCVRLLLTSVCALTVDCVVCPEGRAAVPDDGETSVLARRHCVVDDGKRVDAQPMNGMYMYHAYRQALVCAREGLREREMATYTLY